MRKKMITLLAAAGLLAGCNQNLEKSSQKFNELPPAVQKTVRAQAPQAEIASVDRKTMDGTDLYEITLKQNGTNPKLLVTTDGRLVSTELPNSAGPVQRILTPTGAAGTPFSALPLAAQKTIQSRAPNAQVANITRQEKNGRTIYEVEFSDRGVNPTIRVAEDGTLVQDLQK